MLSFWSDLAEPTDQMSVIMFPVITSVFFIILLTLSLYITAEFMFFSFPCYKSSTHSLSLSLPHKCFSSSFLLSC